MFQWFRLPQKIISDRDPRFTSHFRKGITKALGITQNLSMAFHPQTNGLSERKNQWIEQYLRLICANQDEWAKWLPMVTAVHNNTRNSMTGFAPNTLLLGWEPPLAPGQTQTSSNQKAKDYVAKFQKNCLLAILALNKATSAHAPVASKYTQGQHVWLEGKNLPISHSTIKLSPKRYGPFTITKLISLVALQLDLPVSWNIHPVFHNNLLTPYVETNAHSPNFTRPPPDLINGEAEYEVEAIRSHRYFGKNKKLQYLLKWRGYPEADNTWESEDQLNAPGLLKQYNRCHNISGIKAQVGLAKTHPPSTSPSWSSIPTLTSHTTSTPTIHSSTTTCPQSTCQMSLPPLLRRPRLTSLSHSTPSPTPPPLHNWHPITPLSHRKPRSTSSPPNQISTRRSTRLLMALSLLSTAGKLLTHSKLRSAMKPTTSYKRSSRSMWRRLTRSFSSQAAPMCTSLTTVASRPSSPLERGSSYPPSSSSSGTTGESCVYPGRSITKTCTPSNSSLVLTTHRKMSPSPSLYGSTPCSTVLPPLTIPSAAPSPTSTTGMPPPKLNGIADKMTSSATSTTNSPSSKPRYISLRTTSRRATTALKPPASCPAFRI
jgi:Chromo (CHRromatin Organisation MOdifier) domain